jgi:hypothetical protein
MARSSAGDDAWRMPFGLHRQWTANFYVIAPVAQAQGGIFRHAIALQMTPLVGLSALQDGRVRDSPPVA